MSKLRSFNKVSDRVLLRLAASGWVWEWLRRTGEYLHAATRALSVRHLISYPYRRVAVIEIAAGPWDASFGLLAPEDPQHFYGNAAVFWRPEVDPSVLPVAALSVPRAHPQAVDFEHLPINATILKFPSSEHVLLNEGARAVQLEITHGTVLDGPVRFSHDLRGRETVRLARLRTIKRLAALQETRRLPLNLFSPVPQSERWLRWLKAFDLAQSGLNHSEIARQVYGEVLVEEALAGGATRWPLSRVERLLDNANKMIAGDYQRIFTESRRLRRSLPRKHKS